VLSGIIYVIRHGLQWRDAPAGYGPHKTLYNRFVRWSRLGVFDRIFAAWPPRAAARALMIDSTHLKAHRTAASLLKKGLFPAASANQGRAELQLHAACDGQGRPVVLLLTEGQASDHRGAALILHKLPPARELIGDRGYDSGRFRATGGRGIAALHSRPPRSQAPIPHDASLYRQRHRIEIMFGRLKDWRRIAMRYDAAPIPSSAHHTRCDRHLLLGQWVLSLGHHLLAETTSLSSVTEMCEV
jgi:transposase